MGLAKNLKKLGVKQDSVFYFGKPNFSEDYREELFFLLNPQKDILARGLTLISQRDNFRVNEFQEYRGDSLISTFTSEELGEMLPSAIFFKDESYFLSLLKRSNNGEKFVAVYKLNISQNLFPAKIGKNLTDTMARMLIYLLKSKFIANN